MKVAVISDTHGHERNIKFAVDYLKENNISTILHLGDLGSPQLLEMFVGFDFHMVLGNNDTQIMKLDELSKRYNFKLYGEFGEITLYGKRLALHHGHNDMTVETVLKSDKYDYLLRGHWHKREDEMHGSVRLVNPGSLSRAYDRNSFVVLDIENSIVEPVLLDKYNG